MDWSRREILKNIMAAYGLSQTPVALANSGDLDRFMDLSQILTAFHDLDPRLGQDLLAIIFSLHPKKDVLKILNAKNLDYSSLPGESRAAAICRDIIKMWYIGHLPATAPQRAKIDAYLQGKIWSLLEATAPGIPQGQVWSEPPVRQTAQGEEGHNGKL